MPLPPLLENVRRRPGMYLSRVRFDLAAAFVDGFNLATNNGLLVGFREWLVVKLGYGNNLTWQGLVHHMAFPNANSPSSDLAGGDDENRAVESLFNLLESFLAERESADGLRRVFLRYEAWLKRQEWYGPSSPQWIEPEQEEKKRGRERSAGEDKGKKSGSGIIATPKH